MVELVIESVLGNLPLCSPFKNEFAAVMVDVDAEPKIAIPPRIALHFH